MKAPSRGIKEIEKIVKPHGWTWELGKKHVKWHGPHGALVCTSATMSDHRAIQNALRDFKHQGLKL